MNILSWLRYTVIPWFTALGLTSGTIALEVPGRKSGKPVRVSLTQVRLGDSRYQDMQGLADRYPVFQILPDDQNLM